MMRKLVVAGAVFVLGLFVGSAHAQLGGVGSSGGTSSGLFGSRSVGQSNSIQPTQSSLFGGTGGAPNSSLGGNSAANQLFQTDTQSMSQRSINAGRNLSQSFVGADSGEIRGVGTAGVGTGGTGLQGNRGLQNQFNQNQFRQFDQLRQQFQNLNNLNQQNTRTQVRIALTLGFTPTAPAAATPVAASVERRLPRLPGISLLGTPQVLMEGRTAVIRGVAASERDRELASRLLLLEPGISSVRNEMTVAQASSGQGSIPTPPSAAPSEPRPLPPQS